MKGIQVWASGNPSTGSDYIACLECICYILKYRDYRERVSVNVMLRRWCYHLNLPLVIIHKGDDISQYGLEFFGKEGKNSIQTQNDIFNK